MNDWTIAILPVLGIIVGAVLQFWFSRATEREKQTEILRSQAYADYLRAVATAGHLRSDEDLRDAHRDAADAKARIAVYGSTAVIKALARFEETGSILTDGPPKEAFVALVQVTLDPHGLLLWQPPLDQPGKRVRVGTDHSRRHGLPLRL